MAQSIIIGIYIFPRPIKHCKFTERFAFFRNIVSCIIAGKKYIWAIIIYCATTNGIEYIILDDIAVEVDAMRYEDLDGLLFLLGRSRHDGIPRFLFAHTATRC